VANGGGRSSLRRRRSAEAPGQTGSRGRDGRRGWSRSIAELGEPSVHAFSFWAKACVRPAGPGRTRSWQCTSATVPGGTIKRQQRIAVVADVPAVIGSRLKRSRRRGCRFDGQAGVPPPAGARMPVADCESGARWCRCRQRWRSCLGSGWASAGRLRLLCFVQLASLLRDHEDDRFARGKQQSVTIGRDAEESSAPRSTRHSGSKCADSARGQLWTIAASDAARVSFAGILGRDPALQFEACILLTASRCRRVSGAGRWCGSGPAMVAAASRSSSLWPLFSTTRWQPSRPALVFARMLSAPLCRSSCHVNRARTNGSPLIVGARHCTDCPAPIPGGRRKGRLIGMSRSSLQRRGGVRRAAALTRLSLALGSASGVPSSG
jgi:hypothetical protein